MPARSPALTVVAPCPLRWEELPGNDRVRFCGKCRQHVYNVASLTAAEATALIREREGRACMRLQRRPDGTVITGDCWYTVRRARERLVGTALGLLVAAAGFWSGVGALHRWFTRPAAAPTGLCAAPPPPAAPELVPPIPAPAVPRRCVGRKSPKAAPPLTPKRHVEAEMGLMLYTL